MATELTVFLKAVNERSHAIVPELDGRLPPCQFPKLILKFTEVVSYRVQGDENPWSPRVEGYSLCARGLRLEFGQHIGRLHGESVCAGEAVASTMQLFLGERKRSREGRRRRLAGGN